MVPSVKGFFDLYRQPFIQGLTTNPTLMKKVGITDYETFAKSLLEVVKTKPISFEVFSDEFDEMRRQAVKIRDWQENVYVKIPITNTRRESALPLIKELAAEGVKLNVTALLTKKQVEGVAGALNPEIASVVSVFAGRIADTGVDPLPLMKDSLDILKGQPKAELLWASVREVLNIYQAAASGCHIVTVPHDILGQSHQVGRDGFGRFVAGHRGHVLQRRPSGGFQSLKVKRCLVTGSSGLIGSEGGAVFRAGSGIPDSRVGQQPTAPCSSVRRGTRAGTSSGWRARSQVSSTTRQTSGTGRACWRWSGRCGPTWWFTPPRSPATTGRRPSHSMISTPMRSGL